MAPGPAKAGGRFKTSMMGIAGGGGGVSGEGVRGGGVRGGGVRGGSNDRQLPFSRPLVEI